MKNEKEILFNHRSWVNPLIMVLMVTAPFQHSHQYIFRQ